MASTINPAVPATDSALTSQPIRDNFTAAYNDINGIDIILSGLGNMSTQSQSSVTITGGAIAGSALNAGTVANSALAVMANNTVKGNVSGGSASPVDLTRAQLTALVNTFTAGQAGNVPASGGGTTNFLRADGTFAVPGSGAVTSVALAADGFFLNETGSPITSSGTITLSDATHPAFTLIGNPSASIAVPTDIEVGTTLAFSGTNLQTSALTGDITSPANSFVTTIANGVVTQAKMATGTINSLTGYNNSGAFSTVTVGSGLLLSGGTLTNVGPGSGTVTSVSVVSANGLGGSVATATTTPAITLSTSITGILKGNGTAISAATSGTDYSNGTSSLATGIIKSTTTTGALTIAVAGDFPTLNQNTSGNAATATALQTGRTISISGDLSYTSPSFDGTGNITAAGTLATVNGNVGSFTNASITVNAKGLVTAASSGSSAVTSVSGTANRITSTGGSTPVIDISASYVGQASITTLGTISTGVWQGTLIGPTYGGTGVNNGSSTITLAANLVTSGANSLTLTTVGATNVTLPITGTLLANTLTSANLFVGSAGNIATGVALSGDATITNAGVITVTKTNGSSFGTMATQNANAVAITGGNVNGTPLGATTPAAATITSLNTDQLAGFRNKILNGTFNIWQRGVTTFASAGGGRVMSCDRWGVFRGGFSAGATVSRQTSGVETGFQFYARVQRDNGDTSTQIISFFNSFLTVDSIPLAGKQVTVSLRFRVGSGINISALACNVKTGTGTNQAFANNFTGSATAIAVNLASATTSFATYSGTATLSSAATQIAVEVRYTPVASTAGASDYFDIEWIQLEIGPTATPIEIRRFATELRECKTYYQKTFPYATTPAQSAGVTGALTARNPIALGEPSEYWQFEVETWQTPTSVTTYNPSAGNANWRDITAASDVTVTVDGASTLGTKGVLIGTSGTVTTLGDYLGIHVAVEAELA